MKKNYSLPIALSLAAHAALLLGFHAPVRLAVIPAKTEEVKPPIDWVQKEDERVVSNEIAQAPPNSRTTASDVTKPDVTNPGDVPEIPLVTPPLNPNTITVPGSPIPPTAFIGVPSGPSKLSFNQLDNIPRAKAQMSPVYPFEARQAGLEGNVVIVFDVDTEGHVKDPHIRSSSNSVFERTALQAIMKWRFEPGMKDGQRVPFRMALPMHFTLGEK